MTKVYYSPTYPRFVKNEDGWWINSGSGYVGPFETKQAAKENQERFEKELANEK